MPGTCVSAQTDGPRSQSATPATVRSQAYQQRQQLQSNSPAAGLAFTNIGPSIMSGRVADVAVDPADPTHFYVGYASGGLWETKDNGITFHPLFDDQAVMTIGAIDVHWPSKTIYVGTGEVNSSRSSYAGNGLYKSSNGGKSWTHLGLDETHHIGRVIVDPKNANTVWVAALGHLYTTNPERGVFRTTDGGKTWAKTLFVDDKTGAVDLIRDPRKPNELFAATWERQRWAWDFQESGPGSGIHHSKDGGITWTRISSEKAGFPTGEGAGRIGLAISYDGSDKRHLYASIDNYFRYDKPVDPTDETLTKNQLRSMTKEGFLALKPYQIDEFLRGNGFPRSLTTDAVRSKIEKGEVTTAQLVEYLEDANSLLFDKPVKGFELYHSISDGKNWTRTHEDYLDGIYYTYGYYFGDIAVHPADPSTVYAMGVPIVKSTDGGKTWKGINGDNVHADHHYLWINPARPDHLINGNDGGINISYDGGKNWRKCNNPPLGQFYAVAVDNHPDGYRVYGGLQDNGTWRGPGSYEASPGWMQEGEYPYKALFGGDGMQVQVDPRDNETVYVGFQFGNYYRLNPKENTTKPITPKHELGQRPYRWNWQSPILISPHQPDIFYLGSNYLHRSFNRGDDFSIISPDLTAGGKKGDVAYGTLTTIDESPLQFGLLYTGSDDGRINRSKDAGASWQRIDAGLPQNLWVSRVEASHHYTNVVYATLNGYRNDDFSSYVYRSEDAGQTWTKIGNDLPAEAVNVIVEDDTTPNLLFVGTDHGLYFSLDGGNSFAALHNGLPAVAVHDLVIQPTTKDLIVGTHGRSLYKANVALLQTAASAGPALTLLPPTRLRYSGRYGSQGFDFTTIEPSVSFQVYHPGAAAGATLRITSKGGTTLFTQKIDLIPGINAIPYDLSFDLAQASALETELNKNRKEDQKPITVKAAENDKFYLRPGKYTAELTVGDESVKAEFEVK
ncbi:glycosyl hydrolase [Lewinella lacunae]|uniref:Glycosyl hydrolase n=1 Tax=Neolewinella lacunae TaxID=1517758 RepID=A0A923PQ50_9BACT|nr:glycosyl hydrolase [Neolewinella lacunae]